MKKQKGGIIIKHGKSSKEAFHNFVDNSTLVILPGTIKSASGVLFICTLNDKATSYYTPLRRHDSSIKKIIIKLVAVNNAEITKTWRCNNNEKYVEKPSSFQNEIDIQNEIFEITKVNRDPICPALVHSEIITSLVESIKFIETLKTLSDSITIPILDEFIVNIKNQTIPSIGIIGMEMAEGYRSLGEFYLEEPRDDDAIRRFEHMARLRILETAVKTGYCENDFNRSNVLVNPNVSGYYADLPGHVLIIDYGFASKIEEDKLKEITEFLAKNDYVSALGVFQHLKRTDGAMLNYFSIYGWLYFRYNMLTKKQISEKQLIAMKDRLNSELFALNRAVPNSHDSPSKTATRKSRKTKGEGKKKNLTRSK
jgi:hypothetical protein